MRWVVALFVLLAFAGCVEDDDPLVDTDDDGIPDTPKSQVPRTPPPVQVLPAISFLDPVDLICPDYPNYNVGSCGQFGEPSLEVAGDGTIWYTAVCCVGQSPPIWVSRDGGSTFQALPFADGTGIVRDATGIEGDFAIDDAGNVYFFDIMLASAYFTKYQADGTHVHTKPDVFEPLVDRPWVRAGVEDEVWTFHNTGSSTVLHHSTTGGLVWDYPGQTFPCPLMTFGQGPERNDLVVSGCTGSPAAWITHDGGQTWTDRIDLALPPNSTATEQYMQPSMDAAGNAYVPVTHVHLIDQAVHEVISVYRISPELEVAGPFTVTPVDGLVDKPWSIAGKDGVFAMAYYHAEHVDRDQEGDNATWYLKVSYSLDADAAFPTWHTLVADPEPVLHGTFGRSLGDFLELRQTPDGRLAIAYAAREPGGPLQNKFVQSDMGVDFAPAVFRNGP